MQRVGNHRVPLLLLVTYLLMVVAHSLKVRPSDKQRSYAITGSGTLDIGHLQQQEQPNRRLLQNSYVATACDASTASLNSAVVQDFASKLLGDTRLQLTAARFTGACNALGVAAFTSINSLAQQFSTALVLSTGHVSAVAGDINDPTAALSTNLKQPGDPAINSYTYDAAILELDISIQPSTSSSSSQLVLSYAFASEEYGLANANPDAVVIAIKALDSSSTTSSSSNNSNSLQGYSDLAVLPGGSHIPPPGVAAASAPLDVFYNTRYQHSTVFNGFTQVVPSQGFTVTPGSSYTLRLEVADASNALLDSVLLLPVGSLKLYAAPTAAAGGPYAVAPNAQISLSGSKSTSGNGAIMSYLWRITPYSSSTPLITATNPVVTVPAPPAGQYNVTLDIWDVVGGHGSQTTALSVDDANVLDWWSDTPVFVSSSSTIIPRPTAIIAVNGTSTDTVYVKARSDSPVLLTIDGSSSGDQRGSKLAYSWAVAQTEPSVKQLDLMLPFAEPSKFVLSLDVGAYLVSLDVTGPGGIASAQTLVTVAANNPPIAAAGGPYTATIGVPAVVSAAQSTDPDGDPLTYSWALFNSAGTQVGSYTGQALSMKLSKVGTYTMRLTVMDDRGSAASTVTQITSVEPAPSPPPAPVAAAASPPPVAAASTPSIVTPRPPAVVTYTPTVIAAVPAPPTPSNTRLPNPGTSSTTAEGTYSTQASTASSSSTPAAPTPSPAMCLYSKDSSGAVSTLWDSTFSTMNDYNQIDMASFPSTYWAVCSTGSSSNSSSAGSGSTNGSAATATAPAAAAQPAVSTAVIASPQAFVLSKGDATQVYLDATGSTAAAGRSIIAFSWTVKRKSANAVITQVTGLTTPVWLGPGVYTVALQITDTSGQTATAQRDFSIGDAAATTGVISSPDSFVQNADPGPVSVELSAAGSKPGPGVAITAYQWMVVRLPDLAGIATVQGLTASVSVPVGSYRAYLGVFDSGGGNATTAKDFVVGNRGANGASAVITWPPELVQASSSSGVTTIALDGAGSAPASDSGSITQYVWAIVDMATKTAAGNATGRLTTVNLPPGSYQVGLLVMDSAGNTATARKNFAVGSSTGIINNSPIVKAGTALNGTIGSSVKITGVTDPDGDKVSLTWAMLDQTTGKTTTGSGDTVPLAGLTPGPYLLLITAQDGQGGETSGTAAVTVLPKPGTVASSTDGTSSVRLPATPVATASIKKLPDLSLPQGAVVELDAVSFNLLPLKAKLDSFVWEMVGHGTGEQVATVYGRLGRFELSNAGMFDIKLMAYDTTGKAYNSTGSVRVLAPTAAAAATDLGTAFSGKCGPFNAKQYSKAVLSCPELVTEGSTAQMSFEWKLISPGGSVRSKNGSEVSFVGLMPGHYRVEVSAAIGAPPNPQNIAYFGSTYLKVTNVTKLVLAMPGSLCAGQVVSLHSPALVQSGSAEPDYEWKVTWVGSDKILGFTEVLQGSGRSFGFSLQPGRYTVAMTATMAGGAIVRGYGNITALPCIKCKNSTVTVSLPKDKCSAGSLLAQQVLAASVPQGMTVKWASGTVTTPGQREVSVVSTAVTTGLTATCSAMVNFVDVTPPSLKLLNNTGKCLTPVNSRWMCWKANQLVNLSDNCQAVAPLAFMVRCGEGASKDNCSIRPDGLACVKAAVAGQRFKLQVLARDGFGNIAEAVNVPVEVKALADAGGAGCSVAVFANP